MDWKIYYDDGSTFSDRDGSWEQAPPDGVVAVVVRDPEGAWGRFVYSGYAPINNASKVNEFYVKSPDSAEPYATWDLGPFLRKTGLVKYGRQVGQVQWQAIVKRASEDPDFPVSSPRRRSSDYKLRPISGGKDNPVMDQTQFRFRDDDGTQATATWRQNTGVDDPSQDVDTVYRVRFTITETAGKARTNFKPQLEARLNGGTYFSVTTTSSIVQVAASQLVDGGDTTQQISSTTFVGPTNEGQDDGDGFAGGNNCDYAGNDKCEFEYSYQIIGTDVSNGDTVDLRVAGMDAYTVADATVTSVNKSGQSFTLTAESGSFTETGTAAGLKRGLKVAAATVAFAETGTAASLIYGRSLIANAGTFVETGTTATLRVGRVIAAEGGAFTMTGTDADLSTGSGEEDVPYVQLCGPIVARGFRRR